MKILSINHMVLQKQLKIFFNYAKLENFPFNYGKYANNGVYIMHVENYNLTVN